MSNVKQFVKPESQPHAANHATVEQSAERIAVDARATFAQYAKTPSKPPSEPATVSAGTKSTKGTNYVRKTPEELYSDSAVSHLPKLDGVIYPTHWSEVDQTRYGFDGEWFVFTILQDSSGWLLKELSVDPASKTASQIVSSQARHMTSGWAYTVVARDTSALAGLLAALPPSCGLCLGHLQGSNTRANIESQGSFKRLDEDNAVYGRNGVGFGTRPGLRHLLLIDGDDLRGVDSCAAFAAQLRHVHPELAHRDVLVVESSSSGARNADTHVERKPGLRGFHAYCVLASDESLEVAKARIQQREWLSGNGSIKLTASGQRRAVCANADLLVMSPERLIYEGQAKAGTGVYFARLPDSGRVFHGSPVVMQAKTLWVANTEGRTNEAKQAKADAAKALNLIRVAKERALPEARVLRTEWERRRGTAESDIAARVDKWEQELNKKRFTVAADFKLRTLDHGWLSVQDILDRGLSGRCDDWEALADEPVQDRGSYEVCQQFDTIGKPASYVRVYLHSRDLVGPYDFRTASSAPLSQRLNELTWEELRESLFIVDGSYVLNEKVGGCYKRLSAQALRESLNGNWHEYEDEAGVTKRQPMHAKLTNTGLHATHIVIDPKLPPGPQRVDGSHVMNEWAGLPDLSYVKDDPRFAGSRDRMRQVVQHVFGEGHEVFLDWLAHALQRPWERPQWAFVSMEKSKGTGRGTIMKALCVALNGLAHTVNAGELFERFGQSTFSKLFLFVEELASSGDERSHSRQAAQLRDFVTASRRNVERKGFEKQTLDEFSRLFVATNDMQALTTDADERRFYVVRNGPRAALAKALYEPVHNDLAFHGLALLAELVERDVSKLDIGNAPKTAASEKALTEAAADGRGTQGGAIVRLTAHWPFASIPSRAVFQWLSSLSGRTNVSQGWVAQQLGSSWEKKRLRFGEKVSVFARTDNSRDALPQELAIKLIQLTNIAEDDTRKTSKAERQQAAEELEDMIDRLCGVGDAAVDLDTLVLDLLSDEARAVQSSAIQSNAFP